MGQRVCTDLQLQWKCNQFCFANKKPTATDKWPSILKIGNKIMRRSSFGATDAQLMLSIFFRRASSRAPCAKEPCSRVRAWCQCYMFVSWETHRVARAVPQLIRLLEGWWAVSLQKWTDRCQGLINSWVNNILPSVSWNAFQLTNGGQVWQLSLTATMRMVFMTCWCIEVHHIEWSYVGSFKGIAFRTLGSAHINQWLCQSTSCIVLWGLCQNEWAVSWLHSLRQKTLFSKSRAGLLCRWWLSTVTWKTKLQDVLTLNAVIPSQRPEFPRTNYYKSILLPNPLHDGLATSI